MVRRITGLSPADGGGTCAVAVVVCACVAAAMLLSACGGAESGGAGGRALSVASQTPGAPLPGELSELLGVPVDAAPGEVNQYLIRAQQGSIDLSKVGTIHSDLGYSVGVTWASGTEIGFRYEPFETDSKTRPESELRITAPAK